MDLKRFTSVAGIVFVLLGVLGFVPALRTEPLGSDPLMVINMAYGRLFGLFPVNLITNLTYLGFGVWAYFAARSFEQSRIFCKSTAITFAALAFAGLLPGLKILFGLAPLFGHDVWLNTLIAVGTAYYGYVRVSDQVGFGRPSRGNRPSGSSAQSSPS